MDYDVTNTEEYPSEFTGCHTHGDDMFCIDEDGEDVAVKSEGGGDEGDGSGDSSGGDHEGKNCHFHAGVE